MSKSLKPLIYSFGLGLLSYVFFLCMFQTGSGVFGLIRTLGMALATAPLIVAGISYGFGGFISALIGATFMFSLNEGDFDKFKNYYIIAEIIPAFILVSLGLPFKNKQLGLGSIVSVLTFLISCVVLVFCYIVKDKYFANYGENANPVALIEDILAKNIVVQNMQELNPNTYDIIKAIIPYIPSLIGMMLIGRILLNAYIGLEASFKLGVAKRQREDYLNFFVPKIYVLVVLSSIIAGLLYEGFDKYIMFNISLILMTPIALMGMAYSNRLSQKIKYGKPLLWLFYILVIITGDLGFLATVLLGAFNYIIKQKEIMKV
ncbi:MAG: hypothetical protein BWY78_00142 [Alphaproteobacteria bacterium ADurb.Bin438]|nr:MAG: hypothetical protein BWY78_00142 [Alphaproteobacteria bacterium ADurb.Bin438]